VHPLRHLSRGADVNRVDRILSVLNGVKQTGHGRYLARCPAHEDRSPSLSIRVLDALGLTLSDLFPERMGEYVPSKARIPAGDILQAVASELNSAAILLAGVAERREITEAEWQLIARAARIVGSAAHV
jgi:hypothetical protein